MEESSTVTLREANIFLVAYVTNNSTNKYVYNKTIKCKICGGYMFNYHPYISSDIWAHFEIHSREMHRGAVLYRKLNCTHDIVYRNHLHTSRFSLSACYSNDKNLTFHPFITYEVDLGINNNDNITINNNDNITINNNDNITINDNIIINELLLLPRSYR